MFLIFIFVITKGCKNIFSMGRKEKDVPKSLGEVRELMQLGIWRND